MTYSVDTLLIYLHLGTKKRLRKVNHSMLDDANCIKTLPSKIHMLKTALVSKLILLILPLR